MAQNKNRPNEPKRSGAGPRPTAGGGKSRFAWWPLWAVVLAAVMILAVQLGRKRLNSADRTPSPTNPVVQSITNTLTMSGNNTLTASVTNVSTPVVAPAPAPPTMEINQAVMVTVELDFGPKVPSIAEALQQVERRSQPDDGQGRTFAVIDAYGNPTAQGKLHMSMHVSSEKPGLASLVFKPTGALLWQSRIVQGTNAPGQHFQGKNLSVFVDNGLGQGKLWTIDGSNNPATILEAMVKEQGVPLQTLWEENTEREFTFIYSACGCPVKVKVRRQGALTERTSDQPVLFPDDPAVLQIITRLMGW